MERIFDSTRLYDFRIYYRIYQLGEYNNFIYHSFYFFAKYGIIFFFLAFIYLIIKKKIRAFLCTILAMGVAGFIDLLVFIFWRRPRPFVTYSSLIDPTLAGMKIDTSSFPSSHTYVCFAIATSVFLYGHRRLGAALFLLAVCVAVGRIGVGLHYPSDVIGGALLGIASGVLVYLWFRKWESKAS